jgi:CRISPR-associated protein Csy1
VADKQEITSRVKAIREAINAYFLETGKNIAKVAKEASQLQKVTHALKYLHPDAQGTRILLDSEPIFEDSLVGTHCLDSPKLDTVRNAAYLGVNKFLNLKVGGKTVLDMAVEKDVDFIEALSSNREDAEQWADQIAAIMQAKESVASSSLARQIYFPVYTNDYHLLAPLFPTSLVHYLYERINDDRFNEGSRAAREARKNGQGYLHGFREYPDLAVQKFGGANKQNISQLNSERRGEAYLLASLPPHWQSSAVKPPLHVRSIFSRQFGYRREVQHLTTALRAFLERVKDYKNVHVRDKREEMVSLIIDALIQYAAGIQKYEPGWSRDETCKLNEEERLWLDPGRSEVDPEFRDEYEKGDWRKAVSERFARWLNLRIEGKRTPMGDPEFREWRDELEGLL